MYNKMGSMKPTNHIDCCPLLKRISKRFQNEDLKCTPHGSLTVRSGNTPFCKPFKHGQYRCIGGAVISFKQHSDKKLLEEYDKDSERVHRWLPIEFIKKMKCNHAEQLNANKMSEQYLIGPNNVMVEMCNGRKFRLQHGYSVQHGYIV